MKLIADWGVHSPRLDRSLAAECSHCRGPVGRLVRHEAGAGGTQVWWSCASWFRRANTPRSSFATLALACCGSSATLSRC
jgi:hypothetical protein